MSISGIICTAATMIVVVIATGALCLLIGFLTGSLRP